MTTIPDEVRRTIKVSLLNARNRDIHHGTPDGVRYYQKAIDWLDTLPRISEPDWANAPDGATHHGFRGDGSGVWLRKSDSVGPVIMGYHWTGEYFLGGVHTEFSGHYLPVGIDWRETITKRPEREE